MKNFNLVLFIFLCGYFTSAQETKSVHQLESSYYKSLGASTYNLFDSINNFTYTPFGKKNNDLKRRVFGYHPYWGGSNYLNYHWNLISDLCYFSYEVDPYSGQASDLHGWDTSPAIDSALANDVKVHLCLTLFSGHAAFFGNPDAQQTLISNVINLLENRGAHGVNLDVEALPSAHADDFTNFVINFYTQLNNVLPEAELSMASPAVNWSDKLDIPTLKDYLDFFVVMGYDYYWTGSDYAGPVSPLYSMVSSYNYNFSKTISYYQFNGVPNENIIMAVPYYAYEWETEEQYAPSLTLDNASAKTYRYIRDNENGNYGSDNKHSESNSFGPYFSFEESNWYQCFIDDVYSMGEKYNTINRRDLGGMGIWALGYDNGYEELWNLIDDKFTTDQVIVNSDTIYDSGGPAHDYYNKEEYNYTITVDETENVHLLFLILNLEENYDTLWIYDGPDETFPLIDYFSGDSVPGLLISTGNTMTLQFYSDGATTEDGWVAIYDTAVLVPGNIELEHPKFQLKTYPNPFTESLNIEFELIKPAHVKLWLSAVSSQQQLIIADGEYPKGLNSISINEIFENSQNGIWILSGDLNGLPFSSVKLVKID